MENTNNNTVKVTGRNGFIYNAKHITGSLYIVGTNIVVVEDRVCRETVCKATRANIEKMVRRGNLFGMGEVEEVRDCNPYGLTPEQCI